VENDKPKARFAIGDLVRCQYVLYQFYYPNYSDEDEESFYYGIIVNVDVAEYEDWTKEVTYLVYCTDGPCRFFVEEELAKLS
jgi:hypothetical protein|tara:strand:+ start:2897 stop:3142 length:246 start_codon:yes stop_codon:yes gene_type:complete